MEIITNKTSKLILLAHPTGPPNFQFHLPKSKTCMYLHCTLCGSRKYPSPPPPPRKGMEIPGGGGCHRPRVLGFPGLDFRHSGIPGFRVYGIPAFRTTPASRWDASCREKDLITLNGYKKTKTHSFYCSYRES